MKRRGIKSQSQLARISGVPQSSIHRILARGDAYSPERPTLRKLAVALNTSVPWLADGVEVVDTRPPCTRQNAPAGESLPADGYIIEAAAILADLDPDDRRKIVAVLRLLQQRRSARPRQEPNKS